MSRARYWDHPETGERTWFNVYEPEATVEQLEVLADAEGADIDDYLDERLSTRAVLYRLNDSIGKIPTEIIERKRENVVKYVAPVCRLHEGNVECEGRITRHHFVPRWLMLELPDYVSFAPRSYCTIPACVGWHRSLHMRNDQDKSIAPYLTDAEKDIADHLIESLKEVRPYLYDLIAHGEDSYEAQLVHDWEAGRFRHQNDPAQVGDSGG